jgi:hypothetical protein
MQRGLVSAGVEATLGKFAAKMYEIAGHVFLAHSLTDREFKELPHSFSREMFEASLQFGIDAALYMHLSEVERCDLYCYMVEYMQQFLDSPGTFQGYQVSPRQFLQYLGDAGKQARPNLWTEIAFKQWAKQPGVVICTDARFTPEVEKLDQVIFVKRPGVKPVNPHNSEALAFAIDSGLATIPGLEFIDNDGSMEDLEVEVASLSASLSLLFGSLNQENV